MLALLHATLCTHHLLPCAHLFISTAAASSWHAAHSCQLLQFLACDGLLCLGTPFWTISAAGLTGAALQYMIQCKFQEASKHSGRLVDSHSVILVSPVPFCTQPEHA